MHISNEIVSSLQVSLKQMTKEVRKVKKNAKDQDWEAQATGMGRPRRNFNRSTNDSSRKQRRKKKDDSHYSRSLTPLEDWTETIYEYGKIVVKTINLVLKWKSMIGIISSSVLYFLT